jgi:hypothetical protein
LKQLVEEIKRLKQLVADLSLDINRCFRTLSKKSCKGPTKERASAIFTR